MVRAANSRGKCVPKVTEVTRLASAMPVLVSGAASTAATASRHKEELFRYERAALLYSSSQAVRVHSHWKCWNRCDACDSSLSASPSAGNSNPSNTCLLYTSDA